MEKIPRRIFEKGVALVFVLSSLLTISLLTAAFVQMGSYELKFSGRHQGASQAFYHSESAIDRALQWLRTQPGPPGGTEPLVLFGGWQTLGGGSYLARVVPDPDNGGAYIKRYTIEGWGADGDPAAPLSVRQTSLIVQTESFARFAYFTDNERAPSGVRVWFVTADHIEGPTHTNGQFSMYGSPVFDGLVTSAAEEINYFNPPPAGGNNPAFHGGLELGVEEKPFPTEFPETIVDAADDNGMRFTGNTDVTLLADETMRVTNPAAGLNNTLMSLPPNGVLYVQNGDVNLQGTLNGQLTIGTNQDIRVVNSVTYADDPRSNPHSNDILGLIAGGNVMIPTTAPRDLEVDASMMALDTSFIVESYWIGPPRGVLTVWGGIVQNKRGPVGTFNSRTGLKRSGYTKDYHYDQRLRNLIPPYFPVTGDYVSLLWQEDQQTDVP